MENTRFILLFVVMVNISFCQEFLKTEDSSSQIPVMLRMAMKEINEKELTKDPEYVKGVRLAYAIFDKHGNLGKNEEEIKAKSTDSVVELNKDIKELLKQGVSRLAIQHALMLDLSDHHSGTNKRALYGICDPVIVEDPCLVPSNEVFLSMQYQMCNTRQFLTGCEHCLNPVCNNYGYGLCPLLMCPTYFSLAFAWCNCSLGLGCQSGYLCQNFRPELAYEYGTCVYNQPDGDPVPYDWITYPPEQTMCPYVPSDE